MYSTNPTCTREKTPSSDEHVYAPGRTPSSANICHMWTSERTSNATGYVTRELKRGHPQMTSTCWGTQHAPVGTPPRRAYMCTQEDTPLANTCRT